MRISDWSSDVCSSDLGGALAFSPALRRCGGGFRRHHLAVRADAACLHLRRLARHRALDAADDDAILRGQPLAHDAQPVDDGAERDRARLHDILRADDIRSEEHTSELQSLMRISYAVFCLKKKKSKHKN